MNTSEVLFLQLIYSCNMCKHTPLQFEPEIYKKDATFQACCREPSENEMEGTRQKEEIVPDSRCREHTLACMHVYSQCLMCTHVYSLCFICMYTVGAYYIYMYTAGALYIHVYSQCLLYKHV